MKIAPNFNYYILLLSVIGLLNACDTSKSLSEHKTEASKTVIDTMEFDKTSRFSYGIARVEKDSSSFFIFKNGQPAFQKLLQEFHPLDSVVPVNGGMVRSYKNEEKIMRIVQLENGKYGMLNHAAEWKLKPEYDKIEFVYNRYVKIEKDGKMTYADSWGKLLVPLKYDTVQIISPRYFDVKKNDKWGIYDAENDKIVIPFEYDKFDYCSGCGQKPDYFYAEKNGKWGVIDLKNEVLVPFNYEHVHSNMRSDEWVAAFRKEGKNVIINIPQQKEFGAPEYDKFQIENGHLIAAKTIDNQRYYGVINRKGKEVVPFNYSEIYSPYSSFQSGPYLSIKKDEKLGIIDTLGNIIIPPNYTKGLRVRDDYFITQKNEKVGLLNLKNEELLPNEYDWIDSDKITISENKTASIFRVKKNDKYGFYFPKTAQLMNPEYEHIEFFSDRQRNTYGARPVGLISLEKDGIDKLYNIKTRKIIPGDYAAFELQPQHKVILMKENYGDQGLYDLKENKLILPIKYKSIQVFKDQPKLIKVVKKVGNYQTQSGLFDDTGKEILPIKYADIKQIDPSKFLLHEKDSLYYMFSAKKRKKEKLPFSKVSVNDSTSLLTVRKNEKFYLYDSKRKKLLLEDGYSNIHQFRNGNYIVIQKDSTNQLKFGYANKDGKIIVPVTYDIRRTAYLPSLENKRYLFLKKKDKATGNMLQGFATFEGKVVVPPRFDKVYPDGNGNGFFTMKNNHYGVITADGKELLKPLYIIGIDGPFNSRTLEMNFHFPVPFQENNSWKYMTKDGKILPIKANDLILFQ
ncbi:WG repeat-containing protein [Zunongwangia sp. HGR-M22]|uniref:WG repeat-containing protein n=1 Tax=Zunongwangia sp. HGR-M22 TaxID=3015168 RepID=UPI0022DE7FFA|nr:WG repeat-containing protein [Zunongwangia sp. HGR-M22]WBL27007.1 WG repeat-containing protein [Zunongwangia sp. HGR-M22]